mmetsp:Transcript_23377/g.32048  ORF Transcript_23377/g.32048 Transcript_23377/m.32048 type:complete len:99 (+) Transcript_23377:624-920(+)
MSVYDLEGGDVWHGPVSSAWVVVTTANDTEEAVLTPVSSPTVSANPIVHTVFSTPAVQLDGVVGGVSEAGVVHIDTTSIGFDAVCINICTYRTSHVDF